MCIEIPAHIIYISLGPPDPPSDLEYGDSVVIETSVNLEWRRPSYTGGVPVMNYSVTASSSGGTLSVSDDSERVSYTTPRLVYGDIEVTAINYCGQQSQSASLNILAEGWLSNLVCHILLGVGKGIYLVSYYVGERKRANIVVQLARYFSMVLSHAVMFYVLRQTKSRARAQHTITRSCRWSMCSCSLSVLRRPLPGVVWDLQYALY